MLRARTQRVVSLALVAGAVFLMAGCHSARSLSPGGSAGAESAAQLYSAAMTATASASSVRYAGHVQVGGTAAAFDLVAAGQFGGGTITMQGATLNIVRRDADLYLKATAAAWQEMGARSSASLLAAGKWIRISPPNTSFGPIASLTNLSKLMQSITVDQTPTKAHKATVNGRRTIALTAGDGSVLVAMTGEPYILQIKSTRAGDSGTITFSGYNSSASPSVPAGAVSLSSLAASG